VCEVISLDWTLGLQFLNFLFLLIILNKLLYRPLLNVMAERRAVIDGSQAKAKSLEADIEEKMQRYQQQLNEAKSLATEERAKVKKAAVGEETVLLSDAHHKATARLQVIKSQVAREAADASQTLKTEAEALAEKIATKILGRELA
jgi:F-type H+-transporting ATPase subunit b